MAQIKKHKNKMKTHGNHLIVTFEINITKMHKIFLLKKKLILIIVIKHD